MFGLFQQKVRGRYRVTYWEVKGEGERAKRQYWYDDRDLAVAFAGVVASKANVYKCNVWDTNPGTGKLKELIFKFCRS